MAFHLDDTECPPDDEDIIDWVVGSKLTMDRTIEQLLLGDCGRLTGWLARSISRPDRSGIGRAPTSQRVDTQDVDSSHNNNREENDGGAYCVQQGEDGALGHSGSTFRSDADDTFCESKQEHSVSE
jgi:hypothetical protein